ncbi:DUF3016 domain-containing protein [Roseomonas eburnea]|uniref:DUF3016 domain-containing protein n=1 Tax=Neoroseomonas eburnea TaxID=1346889 RepID=A0A9X9X9R0_9PROT|nr:DUF3016 domain-containing protein [Neoroseomonas eburnea]MBR0680446.1 DUF3016 domain-containing protein [Neoroseomonas eburnea]
MRAVLSIAATGIAGLVAAGPAQAEVRVTFVNPQSFADANLYAARPADQTSPTLVGLRRIFERIGQDLPPGQVLLIEVLDVDLAGYFPPWQVPNPSIRVMEPTTWPRIRLRYSLSQEGRVVASGEETLTDMTYLQRPEAVRSGAPLRFEEPMLLDWFADRFGTAGRLTRR